MRRVLVFVTTALVLAAAATTALGSLPHSNINLKFHEGNGSFFGKVTSNKTNCFKQAKVELEWRPQGQPDVQTVAHVKTNNHGAYSFGPANVPPGHFYTYTGFGSCPAAASNTIKVTGDQ